ncbi:DUF3343 domain-containing protein [Zhaonella formicivorans]|uniref:DUF3343 domain-containing protein n=1 Tax=Zhaonella formicivorans TaxID=2528593 RepID=UPI0010EE3FE4|nr:DUF3343 domain-containing protein [Zhaonella formicivorans]
MFEAEVFQYYILFPNHFEGLRLHKELKSRGVKATITPTPRRASSCCGISLLVTEEYIEAAKSVIKTSGVQVEGIFKERRSTPAVWNKFC